jgi:hypothetical protein
MFSNPQNQCGSEPARDGFVSGDVVFVGVHIRFWVMAGNGSALAAGHLEMPARPGPK